MSLAIDSKSRVIYSLKQTLIDNKLNFSQFTATLTRSDGWKKTPQYNIVDKTPLNINYITVNMYAFSMRLAQIDITKETGRGMELWNSVMLWYGNLDENLALIWEDYFGLQQGPSGLGGKWWWWAIVIWPSDRSRCELCTDYRNGPTYCIFEISNFVVSISSSESMTGNGFSDSGMFSSIHFKVSAASSSSSRCGETIK